ncbi:YppG family protein [Sporolactobacillus sp. Y61]|uniref:YppG family protein n=1 Tax=Sporolactobacillus sp. Y61 TaxID=3160863 RepID=A0AAU8ICA2_9BACL
MIQQGQNPGDSAYDPFTHLMFGSPLPPAHPAQNYYQNSGWQAGGVPSQAMQPAILKPFLDQNGQFDIGKVVNGATQVVSVINQTAPAIKQLSPLLKMFKP